MEIGLIFLFILVAGFIILLAKLFNQRLLILAAGLIFLYLALFNVIPNGYEVAGTFTTTDFNYTYFSDSNTNEVTGFNLTKTQLLTHVQDDFTGMFGWVLFFMFVMVALVAVFG